MPYSTRSAGPWILPASFACLVAAGLLYVLGQYRVQADAVQTLAGATAVVDASRFDSIQAAIDALPETGGLVQLPAGTFSIDHPLRIRTGDVTLHGQGTATHIVNLNEQGQPAILIAHPDCQDARRDSKHNLWRVRLADLRITGNPQSGSGIEARQTNEIFLEGVTVSENGGDGILLDYCYEDPRIADCLITYNKQTGVNLLGCHDIVVSANQFEENQDALHCFDGFNLCMTGNNLDDHLGHGVVIENTYGSVVSGNMIEECQGSAIVLDRDCYGIALSANVIAHNGSGIILRDAHGIAVSANSLVLMKRDALRLGSECSRIAVSGNSFADSYLGEGSIRRKLDDNQAGGLTLESTRDVGITGNVFSSVRPKALLVEGEPRRILFAGNVTVDSDSDLDQLQESMTEGNLLGRQTDESDQDEAGTPGDTGN